MKNYLKAVISGFVIFICSFFNPTETNNFIELHRKYSREEQDKKTREMYGGK